MRRDDIRDLQERIDFLESELIRLERLVNDTVNHGFWVEYTNDDLDK